MSNLSTYEEWRDWAINELHPSAGAWMAAVNEVKELRAELAELRQERDAVRAEIDNIITERDSWEDRASSLAEIVGRLTGADIGEHSNTNDPVANAIEAGGGAVSELAELRKDKARLDYMQRYAESHNGHRLHVGDSGLVSTTDDIREAVDAAMEGGEG